MSEERKHTPGPWRFQGSGHNAEVVGEGALVCSLGYDDGFGVEYAYENARNNGPLIAAAPELLEALEGLLAWEAEIASDLSLHTNPEPLLAKARAALARARGEVGDE